MYQFKAYPKWKYNGSKSPVVVESKEAEVALGAGWFNSPADVIAEPVPPLVDAEDLPEATDPPMKRGRRPKA